jgi:hypothetical protein
MRSRPKKAQFFWLVVIVVRINRHFVTSQLCPWSRILFLFWEANNLSSSRDISAIYGTKSFVTMFTIARQWFLSWATRVQSTPTLLFKIHFNTILPPTPRSFGRSLSFRVQLNFDCNSTYKFSSNCHNFTQPCPVRLTSYTAIGLSYLFRSWLRSVVSLSYMFD